MIGSWRKKSDSISQQKDEINNYFIKNDWKYLDEVRKNLVSNVKRGQKLQTYYTNDP